MPAPIATSKHLSIQAHAPHRFDRRLASLAVSHVSQDGARTIVATVTAWQDPDGTIDITAGAHLTLPARGRARGHIALANRGSTAVIFLAEILGYLDEAPEVDRALAWYAQGRQRVAG